MSSAEGWSTRCGRGRARPRNREHQSSVGHDPRYLGAGDSPSSCNSKNVTDNDITDCRPGTGRTGHILSRISDQQSVGLDSIDNSKKKKPLSSRTKTKKPEIQVYVPRAKRLQQQLEDPMDSDRSGQDDLSAGHKSHQKDITEQKVNSSVDKPVSSRRKHRPEMQRYVPRGKRELNSLLQDNSASVIQTEKDCESRDMRTDKLSSRMGPVKKLKIGENGDEFSSINQSSEQWDEDLTSRFDSNEKSIGVRLTSTFTNTFMHQEKPMDVQEKPIEVQEKPMEVYEHDIICSDSNVSKDTSFGTSFDTSLNTSNFYSMSEGSITEQSMVSDAVCELSDTSRISLGVSDQSDSGVFYASDSANTTHSSHSMCDLISNSTGISFKNSSEEQQCSNRYSKDIEYSSKNATFTSQDLPYDDDDLKTNSIVQCIDPVTKNKTQESANSEEDTSSDSIAKEMAKSLGNRTHDLGTTVDSSPDICYVETGKDLSSMDVHTANTNCSSVVVCATSAESGPSKDEISLEVLPNNSIPNREDTSDVSENVATAAASASSSSDIPSLSSWRSLTTGATDGPPVSGTEVHHSASLPDVVASTMEPKLDYDCSPAESRSDTLVELRKSASTSEYLSSGGVLTSIALKQLDSVAGLKLSPGDEAMNSKIESQSEDEDDNWDAMFDDNGDCLDPSIMEELTAHVGNVQIDKPKINYLKFETKDPDLDMEAYNHVIEIYDFPSEFKTGDLIAVFKDFMNRGFDIKWVDDTHALGVFTNTIAARDALSTVSPLLKVRQMSEASKQSKLKAKKTAEFLQPYKARPQTSAVAARRLVSGALGIQASIPREQRELERQQLKEAKEKRKQARQQKQDIWDGSFGKCAMDEDV